MIIKIGFSMIIINTSLVYFGINKSGVRFVHK